MLKVQRDARCVKKASCKKKNKKRQRPWRGITIAPHSIWPVRFRRVKARINVASGAKISFRASDQSAVILVGAALLSTPDYIRAHLRHRGRNRFIPP
jgi:hypothetical protein